MNTKFKVGDRVRVVKSVVQNPRYERHIGKVYTIRHVEDAIGRPGESIYNMYGSEVPAWYDSELELVKPKFNIMRYMGKYAMHCKTHDAAKIFCKYLDSVGQKWRSGDSYVGSYDCYGVYKSDTCYSFLENGFSDYDYFDEYGYKILEFEDFDWSDFSMKKEFTKKDLKNGDIVKFRKGYTGIVILETGTIVVGEHDYMPLDSTANDLTQALGYSNDRDFDIVAVRRPNKPHECSLQAFKNNYGTLVYERKEVEEMTFEEICKALGKEIKIVKEKR